MRLFHGGHFVSWILLIGDFVEEEFVIYLFRASENIRDIVPWDNTLFDKKSKI